MKSISNDISSINRQACKRTIKSNEVLENLLWSDFDTHQTGLQVNTSRGAGLTIGGDSLQKWMISNDVSTLIRSHQCVVNGAELLRLEDETRLVYTVFSSANYRDAGNDGAVIVLSKNGIEPQAFNADDIVKDKMLVIDSDPHCHHKYSKDVIRSIFKTLDVDNQGHISLEDLEKALQLTKQFKMTHDLDHSCIVGDRIISLQEVFDEMDKDHDGKINIEEFIEAFLSV